MPLSFYVSFLPISSFWKTDRELVFMARVKIVKILKLGFDRNLRPAAQGSFESEGVQFPYKGCWSTVAGYNDRLRQIRRVSNGEICKLESLCADWDLHLLSWATWFNLVNFRCQQNCSVYVKLLQSWLQSQLAMRHLRFRMEDLKSPPRSTRNVNHAK